MLVETQTVLIIYYKRNIQWLYDFITWLVDLLVNSDIFIASKCLQKAYLQHFVINLWIKVVNEKEWN